MRPTAPTGALVLLAPVVLASVVLGGCSASVTHDPQPVSASRLADAVDGKLQGAKSDSATVSDVACDGELAPRKGADQRCHFTDALGDRYGVTVTVSAVDGSDLSYDLDVDPGQTVEVAELVPEVTKQLTKLSGGTAPDAVECPDDLPGRVDATTTCVLTAGADQLETTVTVTSAKGPSVGFDIQVADQPLPR